MFLREQVINDDPAIFVANRAFVVFLQGNLQSFTYLFLEIRTAFFRFFFLTHILTHKKCAKTCAIFHLSIDCETEDQNPPPTPHPAQSTDCRSSSKVP